MWSIWRRNANWKAVETLKKHPNKSGQIVELSWTSFKTFSIIWLISLTLGVTLAVWITNSGQLMDLLTSLYSGQGRTLNDQSQIVRSSQVNGEQNVPLSAFLFMFTQTQNSSCSLEAFMDFLKTTLGVHQDFNKTWGSETKPTALGPDMLHELWGTYLRNGEWALIFQLLH